MHLIFHHLLLEYLTAAMSGRRDLLIVRCFVADSWRGRWTHLPVTTQWKYCQRHRCSIWVQLTPWACNLAFWSGNVRQQHNFTISFGSLKMKHLPLSHIRDLWQQCWHYMTTLLQNKVCSKTESGVDLRKTHFSCILITRVCLTEWL